jgi:penicillin-insensitive murein DD-endopeptidase
MLAWLPLLLAASVHVQLPEGRSVGSPTNGRLVGGAHLADAPYLRVMPADQAGDVRWGLGALVGMVERAAQRVRHLYPGAVLNVGHLSKAGGGGIEQHASHESGRDVDLPFYVFDAHNRQIFADHMVAFRADGTSASWPGAHFDDAKNWALIAALLEDPVARVTHVFVAAPLRARLLSYAEHAGVPEAIRTRAAFAMVQPHGTLPHDDHFHIRIACPSGMTTCIENPVVHVARRGRQHGRERIRAESHEAARQEHRLVSAEAAPVRLEHSPEPTGTDGAPSASVVREVEGPTSRSEGPTSRSEGPTSRSDE